MTSFSNIIERGFWSLPYTVRRKTFAVFWPSKFREYQALRQPQSGRDYNLAAAEQLRCIFVHIPKCAGISLSKSLFGNLGGGHFPISRYQLIYSKEEFNQYYKFTFVRNPWERVYSAFTFLKKGGWNDFDKKWAEKRLALYPNFESFILEGLQKDSTLLQENHFIPQSSFITINGKVSLDFIGRVENIEQDFQIVCHQLGIERTLNHLNFTKEKKQDYRLVYTEEMKNIVHQLYRKDIELLNYNF